MNMKVGIASNLYTVDPFFKNEYQIQIQNVL